MMKFEDETKKYLKNKTNIKNIVNVTNISEEEGIYIVTLNDNGKIKISNKTTAIESYIKNGKEVNLLYDKSTLEDKLKKCHKQILYVGKGDSLKTRIKCLVNYANKKCKNHRGGRALWQIEKWEDNLSICWCEVKNAISIEKKLLELHYKEFGTYPFANWRI